MSNVDGKLIFETVHGSHLYGWAHEGSDMDIFRVTDSTSPKALQKHEGGYDIVTVGFSAFLTRALSGSHQSVEALFSREKVWYNESYRPMLENIRVCGGEVFEKYERTIKKFCYGDFKKRRHACRLSLNLHELRKYGTFDPRVDQPATVVANGYAKLYEGDELWAVLS